MGAYITPAELWRLARPGSVPLSAWEPGIVGDVTKTGAGSGTVTASGYPLDAYPVRVRVFTAGEPGGAARVKVSLDAGLTYPGPLLPVPADDGQALPLLCAGEVALTFTAGAAPSFAAGDVFAFNTTPSPEILATIEAVSADCDSYMRDVFALPLTRWDASIKRNVARLARYALLTQRGRTEADAYADDAKAALKWWESVARGDLRPDVDEGPGGARTFPQVVRARRPYASDWRL